MSNPAPIVFLGPSLDRAEAEGLLPEGVVRPPVARGELYRAREDGAEVCLIVDGLFFQRQALPPREIVDVLEDGACVAGAASLGALRAAECWPAGMLGVGSLYRLFRRGSLGSDDEVAVACDAEGGYRALSVALVNVRYAARRGAVEGWLDRSQQERLVAAAEGTFYSERSWPALLAASKLDVELSGQRQERLASFDLKALDTRRALRALRRWLSGAALGAPRRSQVGFVPRERIRERGAEPAGEDDPVELQRRLMRWQLVSGRIHRYLLHLDPGDRVPRNLSEGVGARLVAERFVASQRRPGHRKTSWQGLDEAAVRDQMAVQLRLHELWRSAAEDGAGLAERLWAELAIRGELEAELFRLSAIREAASEGRRLGLEAEPLDRYHAEQEIALEHGFHRWSELEAALPSTHGGWRKLEEYRDVLMLAKRFRRTLF